MNTVQVSVVTPDGAVYSSDAELVVVKTTEGELGIKAKHIPLVSPLTVGRARFLKDGKEDQVSVSGGFIEVRPDQVTILAETAETPEQIDTERAEKAKNRAEKRLNDDSAHIDKARAEAALMRAVTRLSVAKAK
ncbi:MULTISPECIES: F0F1 ATP synthase subunit epsilon [Shouchella]|uniref:ATP synthase epsilon chain n=3 Tax=Bacillaceae TaxID=186817 RepID=A0A060M1E8_9BACI|nr:MULTISPECIES: F0F1 ATP synthase subunit epsilon [Bacillaceae]RQW18864.1 F0F1 ATP synthase subunit epsilon [Bacillus sp. C1-1]AIC96257.1 ATP synthase epsilon chain [Shouchella lehensis G1]KQL58817.1 ATP synthase F1 subunit epsilon [Alkalicoccobacillus plakortidis]MBG9785147.1 ATP synthase F1 subunit epsilon [Shouchella lehensis]TES46583.1 F0F1 ATP synthase subunit epsilon [Shouchella lehensis]